MIKKFKFNAVNPSVVVETGRRIDLEENDSYLDVKVEIEIEDENLISLFREKDYLTVENNVVTYEAQVFHNEITTAVYSFTERNYSDENISLLMIKLFETMNIWKR